MFIALLGRFLFFGAAGWAVENLFFAPRYSKAFGEAKIPLLPVYGAGGVLITLLAPKLKGSSLPVRAAAYGGILSGLELVACHLDREGGGKPSWDYAGQCIDLPHAVTWAALGLLVESQAPKLPKLEA